VSALRLTVPGNVLLLGEYAVLEEGGLGFAMAVEVRARLEAVPWGSLRVEGSWPGRSLTWTPDTRSESPLVTAVADTVSEYLGSPCTGTVHLDTTAFFSAGGRKAGLGSSAAVCVALACGLLHLAGRREAAAGPEAPMLALRAHRRVQRGRGSGYDILTSFHGGSGLVRGGASPSWQACGLPPQSRVALFPGPAPVSTADAVERYSRWKSRNPGAAADFLRESNAAILSFSRSRSLEEALPFFEACRKLGTRLGSEIGVSAELAAPPGLDARWCKALGAGNELGMCLLAPGAELPSDGGTWARVQGAQTGVTWEQ